MEQKTIKLPRWIGSYQNEGFGKVIFNPEFLCADEKAKLTYKILSADPVKVEVKVINPNTLLTNFIIARQERDKQIGDIYQTVNNWVQLNGSSFQGKAFASQWGEIRNIAMKCTTKEELEKALFVYNDKSKTGGYLVHGVAKDKWSNKLEALKTFVDTYTPEYVINLASIMHKKCSENKV